MRIANYLKKKRLEKGLSIEEFSEKIGLEFSWVWDLELHEDELNGVTVPVLKKMCAALGIQPADILKAVNSDLRDLPLSDLIRARREEMGYSIDKFSDLFGYERKVIEALENGNELNEVCVDALERIAMELDLPLSLIFEKL